MVIGPPIPRVKKNSRLSESFANVPVKATGGVPTVKAEALGRHINTPIKSVASPAFAWFGIFDTPSMRKGSAKRHRLIQVYRFFCEIS
jgi:hypothetical protein